MKNNILLEDYLNYISNPNILFDFKYFLPFYNLSITEHCEYLAYFLIPYSEDLDELIQKLLLKKIIKPINLKNVSDKFFLKMIPSKINLFLQLVNQTEELAKIAIINNPKMLRYVVNQTDTLINYVVENNSLNSDCELLDCIDKQTDEICLKLVGRNSECYKYVKNKSDKLCLEGIKNNPNFLVYLIDNGENNCLTAIRINPKCFEFVIFKTDNICLEAVKLNLLNIIWIYDKRPSLIEAIVKENKDVFAIKELVFEKQPYDTCSRKIYLVFIDDCCEIYENYLIMAKDSSKLYSANNNCKEHICKYNEIKQDSRNTFIINTNDINEHSFYGSLYRFGKNSVGYHYSYSNTIFIISPTEYYSDLVNNLAKKFVYN